MQYTHTTCLKTDLHGQCLPAQYSTMELNKEPSRYYIDSRDTRGLQKFNLSVKKKKNSNVEKKPWHYYIVTYVFDDMQPADPDSALKSTFTQVMGILQSKI